MNYHFIKPTITPHTLTEQLKGLKELLDKRDADMAAFQDTVAPQDEATAFDDLDELRKAEIKRDKWHRDLSQP